MDDESRRGGSEGKGERRSPPDARSRWPRQWREMWEAVMGDAADEPRAASGYQGGQPRRAAGQSSAEPGGWTEQSSAEPEGGAEQRREAGAEEQGGMQPTGLCGITVSGSVGVRGGADVHTRPPLLWDIPAPDTGDRALLDVCPARVRGITLPFPGGAGGSADADKPFAFECMALLSPAQTELGTAPRGLG